MQALSAQCTNERRLSLDFISILFPSVLSVVQNCLVFESHKNKTKNHRYYGSEREMLPLPTPKFRRRLPCSPAIYFGGLADFAGAGVHSSTCLSANKRSRSFAYSTSCTGLPPSIARQAAVAAD